MKRQLIGVSLRAVVRLAVLWILISLLMIVLVGAALGKHLTWQTIGFALGGAILQSAFLGLVYEVWLRDQVENSTLQKIGLSRDILDHGLARLSAEYQLDWTRILDDSSELCIATDEPARVLGLAEGALLDRAAGGHLKSVTIAMPRTVWDHTEAWRTKLTSEWSRRNLQAELFLTKLDNELPYSFVASGSRTYLILPPFQQSFDGVAPKLFEFFRSSAPTGIGAWLDGQAKSLLRMTPAAGVARSTTSLPAVDVDHEESEPEALT